MIYSDSREIEKVLSLLSLPVNSTDPDWVINSREAQIVQKKLDEVRLELLQVGWNFNTVRREYTPTVTGEIYLPNVFSFRFKQEQYKLIGDKLYDIINNTDKFDEPVTLIVIEDLQIQDCPVYFINLVTAQTAWELRSTLGGNRESLISSLQDNWIRYKAIAVQRDIDEQGLNYGNYLTRDFVSSRWDKYFTTF
jgi:hypothetical protein